MAKRRLGIDVLTAAQQRIRRIFDDFPRIYVSFSGGKDSGVLLDLAAEEARARGRRIGVLVVDLEAQYTHTIDYVASELERHADIADPYWVALPLNLRNAVSQYQPHWTCWELEQEPQWVRQPHPQSITDPTHFPFFQPGMEFEEFVVQFGHWYGGGKLAACLVGIRTAESLNRWRTIARTTKQMHEHLPWTTWIKGGPTYNAYPIYDWNTEDIWTYYGKYDVPYNRLYDRMCQAGLTIHQSRICQPYGDDQRRGLWLYHVIEPDTWSRVVARVSGANFGAHHAHTSGNAMGQIRLIKPDEISWEQFAHRLLDSMPPPLAEHYRNKIAVFIRWYGGRGYETIPDEGPLKKGTPSWTRVVQVLLANDYWCKRLSFTPTKNEAYERYKKLMARRRDQWGLLTRS